MLTLLQVFARVGVFDILKLILSQVNTKLLNPVVRLIVQAIVPRLTAIVRLLGVDGRLFGP